MLIMQLHVVGGQADAHRLLAEAALKEAVSADSLLLCCPQGDVEAAQACIHRLQEDLASKEAQLRNKLNANELQLKEQIVYNVRMPALAAV